MGIKNDSPHGRCTTCGMGKMEIEGRSQCPNCVDNGPKTGVTIRVTEADTSINGHVKIQRVSGADVNAPAPAIAPAAVSASSAQPGLIQIGVPTELFAELVVWARRIKVPRDWSQAAKIKAITEFQVQLNTKLGELTK